MEQTNNTSAHNTFDHIANILCFLAPVLFISISSSSSIMLVLLLFAMLHLCYLRFNQAVTVPLESWEKLIIFAWLQFFIVCLISILLTLEDRNSYKLPLAWLFAPIIILSWRRLKIDEAAFYGGLILALLVSGIWGLYDVYILDKSRSNGGTALAIAFANIIMASIFILLCGWHYWGRCRWSKIIVIIACISGYTAILLSQTRGVWLAFPALLILLSYFARTHIIQHKKTLLVISAIVVCLSASYLLTTENNIATRMVQGATSTFNVINAGESDLSTATGQRIELWKIAINLFTDNPIFGVGYDKYNQTINGYIAQGMYPNNILQHYLAHNDILNIAAEMGIIGITSFLIFILLPLLVCVRLYKSYNVQHHKAYSLSAITLIIAYIFFGLTDTVFISLTSQHFYIFILCCIFSLLHNKTVHTNG